MVFDIFGSLRSLLKIDPINIDNNVFKLHYKATVIFLILFSLLVTGRQYFGDPIDCIQRDDIPANIIDTYCWIHSTFTLPDAFNKTVGVEVPHPGIDKFVRGERRIYHKYYQWVCFVLFLQAIMFYVPRYLWKIWEGGRLRSLVLDLHDPILKPEAKRDQIHQLSTYLRDNFTYHNSYFYHFLFCETFNFMTVVVNIYGVDAFLGGEFMTYGLDVLRYTRMDVETRDDPMIRIFPRMTKCTFHRYGPSGDVQKYDALCLLPLNVINEKIYVFLWFWFVFLAIIDVVFIVYRIATIFIPKMRYINVRSRARLTDRFNLKIIMDSAGIGDWFLLYLLSKNMDASNFKDLLQDFAKELAFSGAVIVCDKSEKMIDTSNEQTSSLSSF